MKEESFMRISGQPKRKLDKVGKKGNWYKKDGKYECVVCPTDCRL